MFARKEIAGVVAAAMIAIVAVPCSFGQFSSGPKRPTGPWMDKTLTPDQRAELVVKEMTLDEKIQLVHGTGMPGFGTPDPSAVRSNGGGGFVPGIERLGLPGLKVGYKWFDAEKKQPAYPFGFGLSYTSFAYSNLKATGSESTEVSFSVRNTGKRAGQEVAQVYLSMPASAGEPPKRLIGWEKVPLNPGESKTVTLNIDPLYLSIFDATTDRWTIVPGEYKVMVGPSSATLPLTATVTLK